MSSIGYYALTPYRSCINVPNLFTFLYIMIYSSTVKKSAVWTCYDAKLLHEIIRINVLLISLSHLFLLPFSPFLPPLRHLTLCGPPSFFLSPIPCPFIITPSLPLVSWLTGSRWRGREGGRDVEKEGWKGGGGCCHLFPCSYHHSADKQSAFILPTAKLFMDQFPSDAAGFWG